MTETKLKECPFCGSDNLSVESEWPDSTREYFGVMCHNCETEGPKIGDDSQEAIEAWNRRAVTEPAQSDVESADSLCSEWYKTAALLPGDEPLDWLRSHIAALLAQVRAEATAQERERCAKIFDHTNREYWDRYQCAAAIRGQK